MKASKHEMLKSQWQKIIKDQSEGGLSIREWCRENNISHGKFYYWQRIIREESLIKQNFKLDPFENALFLFCGGKRDRIKAILWEGDGFMLLYKRLEGGVFQWPRTTEEVREISPPTI